MSWLFSQALEAAYSADNCSTGAPFAQLNVMLTPQQFWRNDKMMDCSRPFPFGLTYQLLTDEHGAALLTWYLAAFLAKTSAQRDAAQASTEHAAVCGEKWQELSVKYDRDSCMWKTAQCLWDEDLPESSVTLPRWGMTRSGALYQHKTAERPINATEFGYAPPTQTWATPTTMDKLPPKSAEALHREATIARPGRSRPANLRDQVSNTMNWPTPVASDGKRQSLTYGGGNRTLFGAVQLYPTPVCVDNGVFFNTSCGKPRPTLGAMAKHNLWPTPTVCGNNNRKVLGTKSGDGLGTAVKKWPTPQASDVRDRGNLSSGSIQRRIAKGKQINLSMSVSEESGQLNPDWVEWLMCWPTGWKSLEPLDRSIFEAWQQKIATHWLAEPANVPRVISGMKFRSGRLKAIGNGQVSKVAASAYLILEMKNEDS
jgi:hypothetical protein